MATEKMITIDFRKDGTSKIEAHGFEDSSCLAATKSVEDVLGAVGKRNLKPEASMEPLNEAGLSVGTK